MRRISNKYILNGSPGRWHRNHIAEIEELASEHFPSSSLQATGLPRFLLTVWDCLGHVSEVDRVRRRTLLQPFDELERVRSAVKSDTSPSHTVCGLCEGAGPLVPVR